MNYFKRKYPMWKLSWGLYNEFPFFERCWTAVKFFLGFRVYYYPRKLRKQMRKARLQL